MRPKDYLLQAQKARAAARDLGERIEELRTAAAGIKAITYDKDKVQVSPRDYMPDVIAELIDLEEEYGRRIVQYHRLVLTIETQINGMERPVYADLLRMRYIEGKSLVQITIEMKGADGGQRYSYDYIRKMHGWALEAFRKKYL